MSIASPGLSSLLPAGSVLPAGDRHQVPTGDGPGCMRSSPGPAGRWC